jgi:hypothetical protein
MQHAVKIESTSPTISSTNDGSAASSITPKQFDSIHKERGLIYPNAVKEEPAFPAQDKETSMNNLLLLTSIYKGIPKKKIGAAKSGGASVVTKNDPSYSDGKASTLVSGTDRNQKA